MGTTSSLQNRSEQMMAGRTGLSGDVARDIAVNLVIENLDEFAGCAAFSFSCGSTNADYIIGSHR
jgi:hypothetical protein